MGRWTQGEFRTGSGPRTHRGPEVPHRLGLSGPVSAFGQGEVKGRGGKCFGAVRLGLSEADSWPASAPASTLSRGSQRAPAAQDTSPVC